MPAFLIGRDPSCDIAYPTDETRVSRVHARLTRLQGDAWPLEDLDSANGVFVDGQPVRQAQVTPRSQIRLGTMPFRWPPALPTVPPAPPTPADPRAAAPAPATARRPGPQPPRRLPVAWIGVGLTALAGVGLLASTGVGSLGIEAPTGPDTTRAVEASAPLHPEGGPLEEDFPQADRDLSAGDVSEVQATLQRLQPERIDCDRLDDATRELQALGARLARPGRAGPRRPAPGPQDLTPVFTRLRERRRACAEEEGC